jgi:hypothetical protein
MMLPAVLFVIFLGSCWLYCLTDAVMTPAFAFRGLPKVAWVSIIAATFIVGAIGWLLARSASRRPWAAVGPVDWPAAEASLARHPAGRYRKAPSPAPPRGPDDDPEFLRRLGRAVPRNPHE